MLWASKSSRAGFAASALLFAACSFSLHAQMKAGAHQLPPPPDGVIVEFRESAARTRPAILDAFRRDAGAIAVAMSSPMQRPPSIRREYARVFSGVALHADREMLSAIAALPYVKKIHPDEPVHALSAGGSSSRALPRAMLPAEISSRGHGVTVAILDTGIDYTHPALGAGFGAGYKVAGGHDFVNDDGDPMDDNGHGTHVGGIIAAEGGESTGIAPEATLLAFKVLDAYGSGQQSDVVAALERAVDPNGDGDASDHVDVVNISLGGPGTPDDPQSLAVDAAVAAGVIVCVAAGNEGDSFAILSPGTARDAITVGAVTEEGRVASFSSSGPCVKLASIKPDLVAPGVGIRSTFLNGGYATLNGTSMATPQVAGACALIHAAHASWTPLQVKAALTMTAVSAGAGVMAQGAGILDVSAAASAPLLASQSHFDFGLDAEEGAWRRTRSLTVTNAGNSPRAWSLSATTDGAIDVRVTPSAFELAPGASATITLVASISGRETTADSASLQHGGFVTLAGASLSLHFAWSVVTASRATFAVEQACGSFQVFASHARMRMLSLSPNAAEVYVPPGLYDVVAIGYDWNGLPVNVSLVTESRRIAGDQVVQYLRSDAPNRLVLRGTNARGFVIAESARARYLGRFRIQAPSSMPIEGFDLLTGDGVLTTSDLSADFGIKAAETGIDVAAEEIVALQYPVTRGVSHDVTFASTPADLKRQRLRIIDAGAAHRYICVHSIALDSSAELDPGALVVVGAFEVVGASWAGELYANEESADDPIMAIGLSSSEDGHVAEIVTPALRLRNGRFLASNDPEPSPLLYSGGDGEGLTFGDGPAFVVPHVYASPTFLHTCVRVLGAAGETRARALADGMLTVYDGEGRLVVQQQRDSVDAVVPSPGRERVEFVTRSLSTDQVPMRATLSLTIDGSSSDATPPSLTSIAVLDAAGRMTANLRQGEAGALLFTASDSARGGAYRPVSGDAIRVWFRWSGETAWSRLTPVESGEDGARGTAPLGLQVRVDLSATTTRGGDTADLRIELSDSSGNTSSLTLEPAFSIAAPSNRRRAVR